MQVLSILLFVLGVVLLIVAPVDCIPLFLVDTILGLWDIFYSFYLMNSIGF